MAAIVFIFGAMIGSFLNVVIYRMPLGLSVVRPASRCPKCETPIKPWQNIPVISYLMLRGKCAKCGVGISVRYPLVEALTGALWALLFLRYGLTLELAPYIIFITGLIVVTFIDIDHKIIPNELSLGGMVLGVAASFITPLGWQQSLIGLAVGGLGLWAVAEGFAILMKKEGMGFGDVKLMGAIGAFTGWQGVLFTILVGSVAGSVIGIVAIKLSGKGKELKIPFGPFLSLGAAIYIYRGPELINWYINLLAPNG